MSDPDSMDELTHFDEQGASRMVDVGEKATTRREAVAEATVEMQAATLKRIEEKSLTKGDVLEVARLAGIMAAKRTSDLIPLCHPLQIDSAKIDFEFPSGTCLRIEARVSVAAKTGVEMEALTAATIAALTVYDMCKSMDREMTIRDVSLLEKSGGRSGTFRRQP